MKKSLIITGAVVITAALAFGAVFGIPRIVRGNQEKEYTQLVDGAQYEEAAVLLEEMLEKDEESIDLQERLANAYFSSEQYTKAVGSYKLLFEGDPENLSYMEDYAKALLANDDKTEAIRIVEMLKGATGDIGYYETLVELYENEGNLELALENLEYLISVNSGDSVLNYRAFGYETALGNKESAEEFIFAAVMADPMDETYSAEYAESLFETGRIEEAIAFLNESEALEESEKLGEMFVDYTLSHVNSILSKKNYHAAIEYLKKSDARVSGNELDILYKELIKPPANPSYSVNAGTMPLGETVTVVLSVPERNVQILYTLDGTQPTTNGKLYTEPLNVLEPGGTIATLKAVAINEKGIYSQTISRTYEYPVEFADAALAGIIADYLGTAPDMLTYAMLDNITSIQVWGTLNGINKEYNQVILYYGSDGGSINKNDQFNNTRGAIKTLEDITKFRTLVELSVNGCSISKLPDFSNLNKLQIVRLMDDRIRDITQLSTMVNVRELYIAGNGITSISALKDLDSLEVIWAGHNNISTTGDLSGMTSLTELRLEMNSISSVAGFSNLSSIRKLALGSNSITDISPLAGLTGMTDLQIASNNISDISALSKMISMRELFIGSNNITDVSPLKGMKSMIFLNASYNRISDISPFLELTGLQSLYFRSNKVPYDSSILTQMTWVREMVTSDR